MAMGRTTQDTRIANWRKLLVTLAVFSLTIGLAMRFSAPLQDSLHANHSLKSHSADGKSQHLDRDAIGWVQPTIAFVMLNNSASLHCGMPAATALPNPAFNKSLYNRPPPAAFSL